MYIRGMYSNIDLFKIETNHVVPARGKVLISEPFLCDHMFGRSVILLVDHMRELQEADDLREDDIEMACSNLGLDLDNQEYFINRLAGA